MRDRSVTWLRLVLAAALVAAVVTAVTGCCTPPSTNSTGGTTTATPQEEPSPTVPPSGEESPAPGSSEGSPTAVVPNVLGTYYDQAAQVLMDAGFQPVDVPVHGPIDEDAGEPGKIYRQTPNAGQTLPIGTKVELRSWWESQ